MGTFALEMGFDGGFENYARALESESDALKNANELFQDIIAYFEGRAEGLESPIKQIFDSNGSLIGGSWDSISKSYAAHKAAVWQSVREFQVPFGNQNQVYSGRQYNSLVDSTNPAAIRKTTNNSLEYGTSLDYAAENQSRFHILDFFPSMERGIDRILVRYMQKVKDLEIEE